MLLRRVSQMSGKQHEMDIPCTRQQWEDYCFRDKHIQVAMPDVPAPLREFVKTGITPDEWTDMFGDPLGWNAPYLNKAKEIV